MIPYFILAVLIVGAIFDTDGSEMAYRLPLLFLVALMIGLKKMDNEDTKE